MKFSFDLTKTIENMKKNIKVVHDPAKYDRAIVNHPFYKEMVAEIIKTIKKHNSDPRILEIGMGPGTLTEHILKIDFKDFVGLEPEKEDFDYVKKKFFNIKKNKINFKNEDLWTFSSDEKFDIITTSFVDHHIPMDKKIKYYKKILDLLKPDGIYIAGEEPIGSYTNEDERILKLFQYHGNIIKTCIEEGFFEMAEIETRALKNGIECWDEFKIGSVMYKEILLESGMKVIRFDKLGPEELPEAGVYVVVTSH